jgi:hypothetical protein
MGSIEERQPRREIGIAGKIDCLSHGRRLFAAGKMLNERRSPSVSQ